MTAHGLEGISKESKPIGKNFIEWQTVERISKIAHRHEEISKNSKRTKII